MDWGLAKVLAAGRPPASRATGRSRRRHATIRTPRRGRRPDDAGRQRAGHAGVHAAGAGAGRGRARSTGASTCSGWGRSCARSSPASRRTPAGPRRRSAAGGRGRPGRRRCARLDACGADAELVALAKRCLAPGQDATGRPTPARWRRPWRPTWRGWRSGCGRSGWSTSGAGCRRPRSGGAAAVGGPGGGGAGGVAPGRGRVGLLAGPACRALPGGVAALEQAEGRLRAGEFAAAKESLTRRERPPW